MSRLLRKLVEVVFGRAIDDRIRHQLLYGVLVFGDSDRLTVAASATVNNALFNTVSGNIVVEADAFFGHNVCVLTGTHDVGRLGLERQTAVPTQGQDILIKAGAWLSSNVTIIGPCVVGEHSVVAAGAVVVHDVAPFTIVGGVPARHIGLVAGSVPLTSTT